MGSQPAGVRKETICSFRHDINKRAQKDTAESVYEFFHAAEREMPREPEVLGERVPVVECLDGHERITSKELAPIHSVKSGTLQNACSTRPRVVVGLGTSAPMRTARWKNNLVKGQKRMTTKNLRNENLLSTPARRCT